MKKLAVGHGEYTMIEEKALNFSEGGGFCGGSPARAVGAVVRRQLQ